MRRSLLLAAFAALMLSARAEDADLAPALLQGTKAATALVDLGEYGSASSFLVHASGIFATNAHVVRGLPAGRPAKLVLHSGEKDQSVISARVVLVDEEDDLALLKTDSTGLPAPLPLGDQVELAELSKAIVFGYPFGKMLSSGDGAYPAVSINAGRISALRRKGERLELIQIDAATNPGNSGGPLIDTAGRVIGVIVSGINGASVNFAIPAARLHDLIKQPVLSLRAPEITYPRRGEARDFELEILPTAPVPAGATLSFALGEGVARRTFPAVLRDGRHRVQAAPMATTAAPQMRLEARFDSLIVALNSADLPVQVGDQHLHLSELRSVDKPASPAKDSAVRKTTLTNYVRDRSAYEMIAGKVAGLPPLHSALNGIVLPLESADFVRVCSGDPGPTSVPWEITLTAAGKNVASSKGLLRFSDPPARLNDDENTLSSATGTRTGQAHNNSLRLDTLLRPERDGRQGMWKRVDKDLTTIAEPSAWCEIPAVAEGGYRLTVSFTPQQSRRGELLLQLPCGEASALLHVDGAKGSLRLDLNGAKPGESEIAVPIATFTEGEKHQFQVLVEANGKVARIVVWFDASYPLNWTGNPEALVRPKALPVAAGRLAIGQHDLAFSLQSLHIRTDSDGLRILSTLPGEIRRAPSDMLGRWSFDTPPAEDKVAANGTGRAATLIGTPTVAVLPGVIGGAMYLSGESPAGLKIDDESFSKPTRKQRTAAFWFKAEAPPASPERRYLYNEGNDFKGVAIYLLGETLTAGNWNARAGPGSWLKAPGIKADRWYHVALVLNAGGEDKSSGLQLYLDGQPVAAGAALDLGGHEGATVGLALKSTRNAPDDPPRLANRPFRGLIDEVEIQNFALHAPAISVLAGGRFGIDSAEDRVPTLHPSAAVLASLTPKPPSAPTLAPPTLKAPPPSSPVSLHATPAPASPAPATLHATPAPATTPVPRASVAASAPAARQNENFAAVEAADSISTPLSAGETVFNDTTKVTWTDIPPAYQGFQFSKSSSKNPTLRFKVVSDGLVRLACTKRFFRPPPDAWNEEQLRQNGWRREAGAELKDSEPGNAWLVFTRGCRAGEEFAIRTEKYESPILLLKMATFASAGGPPLVPASPASSVVRSSPAAAMPLVVATPFSRSTAPAVSATPAPAPATSSGVAKIDKSNPARVEVEGAQPEKLAESSDPAAGQWEIVAPELRGAAIYGRQKNPVLAFKVAKAGRVYVFCDYGYEGSPGSGWKAETWQKSDFLADGWVEVAINLKPWKIPPLTVFTKVLPAGSQLNLRCNKYRSPFVLTY